MTTRKQLLASAVALACAPMVASAQHIFFQDDFSAASESRYDVFTHDPSGVTPDDVVWMFGFDYGAYQEVPVAWFPGVNDGVRVHPAGKLVFPGEYVRDDPDLLTDVWAPIPPAPNSVGGSTTGLYVAANLVAAGGADRRSLANFFPKVTEYAGGLPSGDFKLQFDVWMNYTGRRLGDFGSTEWTYAGINMEGGSIGGPMPGDAVPTPPHRGFTMAISNERGAGALSYRFYRDQARFTGATLFDAGWIPEVETINGTTLGPAHGLNSFYQALFPFPDYETEGAPGKNWLTVESVYIDNIIYNKLNGVIVNARTDLTSTSGHVMIGYGDHHASSVVEFELLPSQVTDSQGNPVNAYNANFAVFDNIIVVEATEPRATWNVDSDGNWSNISNWLNANPENGVLQEVPNHVMHVADFKGAINDDRTVTVDAPHTVRSIVFDNADHSYTIAGSGTINLDALTVAILTTLRVNAGQHTISAPISLQRDTVVNVGPADGMLTLSGPLDFQWEDEEQDLHAFTIVKSGAGTLTLHNLEAEMRIALNQGTVRLAAGSGPATIVPETIGIAPGAALDLTDNRLTVQGGDLAAVSALVGSGFAAGTWTGDGINSSAAAAQAGRALGVGPDGDDVVVMFTWGGDATLDGVVNISDLSILAGNWQQTDRLWFQGDFNYDGIVNISDLSILAGNWQKGAAGGMSFEEALAMFDVFDGVVVPEPGTMGLLSVVGLLCVRRRRARD